MNVLELLSPDYFLWHVIFLGVMGLVVGSFLNVCIYRIPAGKSIVFPNSFCFTCGIPIKWYDNIPLLSYLVLGGRCRTCGARISPRYFLVELLTGILFVVTFYKFRYTAATPVYLAFFSMLIIATFTDIDHWIIPDSISLGGFGFALVVALLVRWLGPSLLISTAGPFHGKNMLVPLLNALVGAAFGFALLYGIAVVGTLAFRREAMGGGDIKLFAFIGAMVGWLTAVVILACSSFLGAIIGVSLLISHRIVHGPPSEKSPSSTTTSAAMEAESEQHVPGAQASESHSIQSDDAALEQRVLQSVMASEASQEKLLVRPHPMPFGPYIALASIIVVLWHREIFRFIHTYLFVLY
jgi:leader peptidase (prepilin peptidase)/N-methyltransferase